MPAQPIGITVMECDQVQQTVPELMIHNTVGRLRNFSCIFFCAIYLISKTSFELNNLLFNHILCRAGIAQSVQRLATGWKVRGLNPGGGEISHTRPDRTWGPTSLLYNGYRIIFLGVKRSGRGVEHPPHLAPRLKKEQSSTSTPLPSYRVLFYGELYLYFTFNYLTFVFDIPENVHVFGRNMNLFVAYIN